MQGQLLITEADGFLAQCAQATLGRRLPPTWPEDWIDEDMLAVVAARVGFHGIAVLLGETPDILSGWPETVASAVREEMHLAALWEEVHWQRVVGVIDRLAEAGIETMVLKGTAVAYLYYPDPAARRRGDTDLLVRPDDLARVRELLSQAGCYRREDPHGLNFQESWLIDCGADMVHTIDLHWEPADRPMLQMLLRADRLWDERVPVPRFSPHAAAPDPVMLLLHAAINQAWHEARGFNVDGDKVVGGKRLIWAIDYEWITGQFTADQWQDLAAFCERHDAASIVRSALLGARDELGTRIPADVLARLSRAAIGSPTHNYIRRPGVIADFARDFLVAESLAVRWHLIHGLTVAPRSHLVGKYPHLSGWPTFLLQLRRYGDRLMRWPGRRGAKR